MKKIKRFFLRLVAKRVIDKTTGKERWEKSKGKLGALIAGAVYIIEAVLPAFDIHVKIPPEVFEVLIAFGITLAGFGIRDAQERTEDKLNNLNESNTSTQRQTASSRP